MISIIYLLTSKWHDVDEAAIMIFGLIDLLIIAAIVGGIALMMQGC